MSPGGYRGLIHSPSDFFLLEAKEEIVDILLSGGVRWGASGLGRGEQGGTVFPSSRDQGREATSRQRWYRPCLGPACHQGLESGQPNNWILLVQLRNQGAPTMCKQIPGKPHPRPAAFLIGKSLRQAMKPSWNLALPLPNSVLLEYQAPVF